jgi:hypothetical protein
MHANVPCTHTPGSLLLPFPQWLRSAKRLTTVRGTIRGISFIEKPETGHQSSWNWQVVSHLWSSFCHSAQCVLPLQRIFELFILLPYSALHGLDLTANSWAKRSWSTQDMDARMFWVRVVHPPGGLRNKKKKSQGPTSRLCILTRRL